MQASYCRTGRHMEPEMEFLDINWTKDLSFCSMLYTVSSTGGFYRKPYSSLVLKLHKKCAKQKNCVYSLKAFCRIENEDRNKSDKNLRRFKFMPRNLD
jgi:hypothetical protein